MNKIQIKILTNFIGCEKLKYTDAKPEDIENDLYKYHLNFLKEKGYIKKYKNYYNLTQKGKLFGIKINAVGDVQNQFYIHVACFVVRKNKNLKELLLQTKRKHPYMGDNYVISGKVQIGERIEDAASRKLFEETGLICNNFKNIGVYRMTRQDKQGKIVQDGIFFVCFGTNPQGELVSENKYGNNYWISFPKALTIQQKNKTFSKYSKRLLLKIYKNDFSKINYHESITIKDF